MKNYLLTATLLLASPLLVLSQSTVFDLLGLAPEGCPLEAASAQEQRYEEAVADMSTSPSRTNPAVGNKEEIHQALAVRIQEQARLHPELFQTQIAYDATRRFVRVGELWGLQQRPTDLAKAKMLLQPQFDHVVADTTHQGFIAYRAGKANFYDLSGQPKFANKYYDIEPTVHGHFKVYTADGIGLVDAKGKQIIAAENKEIGVWGTSIPYYYVRVNDEFSYVLSTNSLEPIHYNASYYDWNFINERYVIVNNNALIDLKKKRSVFCGKPLHIRSLDAEKELVHLSLADQPNRRYIAYLDGRLLSEDPYYEVNTYYPEGYIQVALPKAYQPGQRTKVAYGVIDLSGEWILPVEDRRLIGQLMAGKYLQAMNERQESTLLDLQGTVFFPYQAQARFARSRDSQQLEMRYRKDGQIYLQRYDLASQYLLPAKETDYLSTRPFKFCETGDYQVADTAEGEILLSPDGQVALPQSYSRLFFGPTPNTLIAMTSAPKGSSHYLSRRQLYTCAGELQTFEVEGETVSDFYNFYYYGEDLSFLSKNKDYGHFILPNGEAVASSYGWYRKLGKIGTDHVIGDGTNKYGLVSARGETLIPPTFGSLFYNPEVGLIRIRKDDNDTQWMQPDGKLLFDGQYEEVQLAELGLFRVRLAKQWGLANRSGTLILPVVFQSIYRSKGLYVATRADGTKEYYDYLGQRIN